MRKLIIWLTIFSVMNLIGCYSYQEVTKDEFIKAEEHVDLQIMTKNQYIYKFDEGDYTIKEDSLYGMGKFVNRKNIKTKFKDFTGSIYLEDIETFKFDKFSTLITIIGIATIAAIIAIIAIGISNINIFGTSSRRR